MPFTATDFQDSPSTATPITAAELDKLGTQYAQALADVPSASTSAQGKVELATSAETITGTDTARAVTPAGLQAKVTSETVLGLVELATAAETTTGTDNTRAVHPAGLKVELDKKITAFADPNADRIVFWDDSAGSFDPLTPSTPLSISGTTLSVGAATTSAAGVSELLTGAEAVSGTDATRTMTADAHRDTWGLYYGVNAQTGTTYAPVLEDQGKIVTCANAAAITVTMPSNATTAFPIGTQIDFAVLGAGMVTFVAGSGATVNGTPSLVSRATYSAVSLLKLGTDYWLAVGDLA